MGPLNLINHLLNLVAPALVVSGLVVIFGRFFMKKPAYPGVPWKQFAINFLAGSAALTAGLVFLGRDGKMLTYLALVLAIASSQWLQVSGWRK